MEKRLDFESCGECTHMLKTGNEEPCNMCSNSDGMSLFNYHSGKVITPKPDKIGYYVTNGLGAKVGELVFDENDEIMKLRKEVERLKNIVRNARRQLDEPCR